MKKINLKKIVLSTFLIVILFLFSILVYWLSTYYRADDLANLQLISDEKVLFSESGSLNFVPVQKKDIGIIIYPGGLVEAKAYSVLAKLLSLKGYPTFIVQMPLNLAVFNINGAESVINNNPDVNKWVIAGHSLGGSMAAKYVDDSNNPKISGLVFLASYPDTSDDLSDNNIFVLSIRGNKDNIVNNSLLNSSESLLPPNASYINLEGANHSQFGSYGLQYGDGVAEITPEKQVNQVVNFIDNFITLYI